MRNLTILREKTFVGCLGKMKVYIEDPERSELTVNNTPCRFLGTLKNGEEKTFSVEEDARKLYVIADKVSKDYCCELYELEEGAEDISLKGRNCFEPSRGNAFRFENNTAAPVLQQRRHGKRIGLVVLICSLLIGFVIGLGISSARSRPREKTFTDEGLSVTLTTEFRKTENENYLLCYSTKDVGVLVIRETFAEYPELKDFSADRYARLSVSGNELGAELQHTASGIPYFEWNGASEDDRQLTFRAYTYKTDDAFWLIQFLCETKNEEALLPQFDKWADTVSFTAAPQE